MDQTLQKSLIDGWTDALVKQRVKISLLVFLLLLLKDIASGAKPHDTFNLSDPYALGGIGLVVFGLAIRSWAAGVIRKSKVLATTGPYRLCRHPLYLGSLALMLAFCTIVGSVFDASIVLGPMLGLYLLTIRREERRLAERHGDIWRQYAATAPRLIPKRLFTNLRTEWSFAQWLSNREYKALCTALAALAMPHFWP